MQGGAGDEHCRLRVQGEARLATEDTGAMGWRRTRITSLCDSGNQRCCETVSSEPGILRCWRNRLPMTPGTSMTGSHAPSVSH